MTKEDKIKTVTDLKTRLQDAELILFASFNGLPSSELFETKKKIRGEKAMLKVVKNTLLKKAFHELHIQADGDDFWKGEIAALAGRNGDPVALVKILAEWAKKNERVRIKGGYFTEKKQWLNPKAVNEISKLSGLKALQAECVGTLQAPLVGLAGALGALMSNLVLVLSALKQKQQQA